jgi:hypothetical protein
MAVRPGESLKLRLEIRWLGYLHFAPLLSVGQD